MRTANSPRPVAAAIVALAAILAVSAPAAAQSEHVWKHGIISPKADAGFYFMVANGGFAQKQGLKVEFVPVKDDQIGLKAMLAGELDSYEGGPGGAIAAAAHGADVKIIGCDWLGVPHGIMTAKSVNSLDELKGKSIATSAPGSMPDMLARIALAKAKVPESEVKLAAVGGDKDRYQALVGGVVAAAVVSSEYLPLASSKDFKMLVQGKAAMPEFIRTCLVSSGKTLSARRDDAIKFMTAELNALHYAATHKDETLKLTREIAKLKADDPRPAFVFDEGVQPGALGIDLPLPVDKLAWMADQMRKLGKLKGDLDIAKIVDTGIREEALKRAGKS